MPDAPADVRSISVLVVDDSAFMRQHLRTILEGDPGVGPVIVARDGQDALKKIGEHSPDVVTLDVNMPVMDGLETLRRIMAEAPRPCVMLSSLTQEGAAETLEALELGAIDVIGKPSGSVSLDIDRCAADIRTRVKAAARARYRLSRATAGRTGTQGPRERVAPAAAADERGAARPAGQAAPSAAPRTGGPAEWLVAIGVSTGGPRTLMDVLPKLPANIPAAVAIVQHLPPAFTRAFAERLNTHSALRVKEAEQGEPVCTGIAYVGPGGMHLTFRASRLGTGATVHLTPDPADVPHRPSVDVMMGSATAFYGARMVGVLLTGMGADGANAMVAARQAGAVTIAESQETAVVFGMPKEAITRGGASVVAPAPRVAEEILRALPAFEPR